MQPAVLPSQATANTVAIGRRQRLFFDNLTTATEAAEELHRGRDMLVGAKPATTTERLVRCSRVRAGRLTSQPVPRLIQPETTDRKAQCQNQPCVLAGMSLEKSPHAPNERRQRTRSKRQKAGFRAGRQERNQQSSILSL